MKKTIMAIAVLFCTFTVATGQDKKVKTDTAKVEKVEIVKAVGDTVIVLPSAKVIEIAGKKYSVDAFKSLIPVFFNAAQWTEILNIINTRSYGLTPATVINQIIQGIGQLLPPQQNQ